MGAVRHPRLEALLDVHSFFSFGRGVSSPTTLVTRATELGYTHLALTDELNVGGTVELYRSAKEAGIVPLIGATVPLSYEQGTYPVVLIAASRKGYQAINELITLVLYHGEQAVPLPALLEASNDIFLLTGARQGFPTQLLTQRRFTILENLLRTLRDVFQDRLFVQLYFEAYPNDTRRVRALRNLAKSQGLRAVAAPQVRYAGKNLFPLYDALICARQGISVNTPHPERPLTRRGNIPTAEDAARAFLFSEVLRNANVLAQEAAFELLPERLTPPAVRLPKGETPDAYLRRRCREALPHRFQSAQHAAAEAKLEHELATITKLGMAEFFLAAAEVVDFCYSRGILAAGRGSAAASITCYLLGITHANPLEHNLLFERFLHGGKTQMPDVDIDISSSRRQEVLDWVEQRFGGEGEGREAMVANRITYRLRSAIQDVGRALGLPPHVRNQLSHALGRDYGGSRPHRAWDAEERFTEVLGKAPAKRKMLEVLSSIEPGLTRHFAPHSGGVVLSRYPLSHYSPQFKSANGMRVLQFDKDDVERLGLIKLDLLGLRMLSALEWAREEVHRQEGVWLDFGNLPDEPDIWDMVDVGETLTLFQIESPGQTRLSVQLKPRSLTELAHQIAIHRPGPIQSGTVKPYIKRHLRKEAARYAHPVLKNILGQTYGVVLFQEDVLRLAVHFAGMSWVDGDRFRKSVSKAEDADSLEAERQMFVEGAKRHAGASQAQAEEVFEMIQNFRGYGFAQSHAFAFAQHAYASAYLKYHYPAEWIAAVLNEAPGMWPLSTVRQDARKYGVPFFELDINRSWVGFRVERNDDGTKGVRAPLTAVGGISRETAQRILVCRLEDGPFKSIDNLYERLKVPLDALSNLVRAGAFDGLSGRRQALYRLHALSNTQAPGVTPLFSAVPQTPPLKRLHLPERFRWDMQLMGFSKLGVHPLDIIRNQLQELGVIPLSRIRPSPHPVITAGLIIARQKPPTAGGAAFYVIEDGTVRVQVHISPALWEEYNLVLRDAQLLMVEGQAFQEEWYLAIRAHRLWQVPVDVQVKGYHFSG